MAMSWTSLTAAKGQPGAIATWLNYAKLSVDVDTFLDEAQSLLFTLLRCREMRSRFLFTMPVGSAYTSLPAGFLDPIGRMYAPTLNMEFRHKDEAFVQGVRNYFETNGTLGANPFTTVASSNTVTVNFPNHGFSQDSIFYTTGATTFNGATITGTFQVTAIVDVNNFTIDISTLGSTPSASGAGGGVSVNYTCDILSQGSPLFWMITDELIKFDFAFDQQTVCELYYFKSPGLLSSTNQTNWLTNRYPHLLRETCNVLAVDWMRDSEEYQKHLTALTAKVQAVSIENDMFWRGAEINTETP